MARVRALHLLGRRGLRVRLLVIILLKNAGGAPQLKQRKFKLTAVSPFTRVMDFLREQLKLKPAEPLFLFINSTFQPNPEATVGDLFKVRRSTDRALLSLLCPPPAIALTRSLAVLPR